ncbi:MAG: hypothetical protein JW874_13855, partial [Spirochaetales bacterium]|nr:hypothetical protein [Spirochaetales bacterium]
EMENKKIDIEKMQSLYCSGTKLRFIHVYENDLDFSHNIRILRANTISFENIDDFFVNLPDVYFSTIPDEWPALGKEDEAGIKTPGPASEGKDGVLSALGEELRFAELLGPRTKFRQLWQIAFSHDPPDNWNPDDGYYIRLVGETDSHFFYLEFEKAFIR